MSKFTSDLFGMDVIGEDSPIPDGPRGLIPRDFNAAPVGSGYAAPFNLKKIDRAEWPERIADLQKNKARNIDVANRRGLVPLHQGRTNGCWANAVVYPLMFRRVAQKLPNVLLSPASLIGPITGWRNVGGWPLKALEYAAKYGVAPADLFPCNEIDQRYDTPDSRAARSAFEIDEWLDLPNRDFDALATCLLMGFPCATAHNWWRHAVSGLDLLKLDGRGRYGILFANSGAGRDANGYTILDESRATPDEALACCVVTSSKPRRTSRPKGVSA